jgi:hypothetical protein
MLCFIKPLKHIHTNTHTIGRIEMEDALTFTGKNQLLGI